MQLLHRYLLVSVVVEETRVTTASRVSLVELYYTTTMAVRGRLHETLNIILDSLSDAESDDLGEPMCPGSDKDTLATITLML